MNLTTLLNLTLIAQNPNINLVFFYEPFTVILFSDSVHVINGSLSGFTSDMNNQSRLSALLSSSRDLDTKLLTCLRLGLKKTEGLPVEVQMDTKAKLKRKRVGIRVKRDGIKATVMIERCSCAYFRTCNPKSNPCAYAFVCA